MLLFVTSLGCKSLDRNTFCMKRGSASYYKCAHGQRFYNPMKLQKEAFNTYNYIFFSNDHENTNFIIVLFNSPVHFIVGPRVIMNEKFY